MTLLLLSACRARAVCLYQIRPRLIRLDAAYWGLRLIAWIHAVLGAEARIPWNPREPEEALLCPSHLDQRRTGQTQEY